MTGTTAGVADAGRADPTADARQARRRRRAAGAATAVAWALAVLVAFALAGLAWLEFLSRLHDPGSTMFVEDVREARAEGWDWGWGLPTMRAEGLAYDGSWLVASVTVSPWVYAPLVVAAAWWLVTRTRARPAAARDIRVTPRGA